MSSRLCLKEFHLARYDARLGTGGPGVGLHMLVCLGVFSCDYGGKKFCAQVSEEERRTVQVLRPFVLSKSTDYLK